MVRYSKLPFRELVRRYKCDIVYTPMILANVFAASQYSRDSEFSTNRLDDPVVIQFAASNAVDLANAAELAAPYVSGIDINCGCPQKWAIEEKIGSHLMSDPETVRDMIRQTKARVRIPCSIKIRIHPNLRETEEFVKRALSVGVDFITVHGRTRRQKSTEPVNIEGMKLVKETSTVPVIANGDVFSLQDAEYIVSQTGVNGTMAARGILENPALYAGYNETPWECIEEYVALAMEYGTNAFIFHHHLMYMFERVMSNAERKTFNSLTSVPAILDYLDDNYGPLDIPAAKARLRSPLII
ncbi:tRNA-dihydrouridine(20a/20b) synthase [NAD(P)+]-like protein [Actinomortierella wolfii]|nr:tRNA-dihydrouridine(20a/20b) synthase [NAD(P)+]-like protein [Actinomortierella wolfii]